MREHCLTEASNISTFPLIAPFSYPEEPEAKSKEGWSEAKNTKRVEVILLLHYQYGRPWVSLDLRETELEIDWKGEFHFAFLGDWTAYV